MTTTPTFEKGERGTMDHTKDIRPLLLLDIDGVLNAFPPHAGAQYTRRTIDGYQIHLHTEVGEMVAALAESFEIVWFTLWNHRASPAIGPHVGLAGAAHLTTSWERGWEAAASAGYDDDAIAQLMYAKTPLLPELIEPGRPWAWIDDAHSRADADYLIGAGLDPRSFRLVGTDPQVGLMWDDVAEALAFARSLVGGIGDRRADSFVGASADGLHFPGSVVGRVDAVADQPDEAAVKGPDDEFAFLLAGPGPEASGSCPDCGAEMRPVVYGYPSVELIEQAERGEVILGGCVIPAAPVDHICLDCGDSG